MSLPTLPTMATVPSIARRSGEPPIITAVVRPFVGPLEDGDTIGPALSANYDQTTNYRSLGGDPGVGIVSASATLTVNGVSATTSTEVTFEDVVLLEVLVTDSEGNARTFRAGRVVPADVVAGIPDNAITLDGTAETALSLDGTEETIIILEAA